MTQIQKPPIELNDAATAYWNDILLGQKLDGFAAVDWLLLCKLCRDMAAEDTLTDLLEAEGYVLTNPKTGATKVHPASGAKASLSRAICQVAAQLRLTRSSRSPRDSKSLRED